MTKQKYKYPNNLIIYRQRTGQQIGHARKLIKQGEAPQSVASLLRVSRATLYRAL